MRREQLGFHARALTTVLSLLIGAFTIWRLVLLLEQLRVVW
jgi:hypothetical protein